MTYNVFSRTLNPTHSLPGSEIFLSYVSAIMVAFTMLWHFINCIIIITCVVVAVIIIIISIIYYYYH